MEKKVPKKKIWAFHYITLIQKSYISDASKHTKFRAATRGNRNMINFVTMQIIHLYNAD